jgi:hypothetical protein
LTADRIGTLAARRDRAVEEAAKAHRELLDAVLAAVDGDEEANVTDLAKRAKIARQTIYNELARRQDRRDQLSNGGGPPP